MSIALKRFETYAKESFPKLQDKLGKLQDGQEPKILFITCSDSRVMPTQMTNSEAGELFVIRNAGNLIPAYSDSNSSSEALTIEYAVEVLKVEEIVVCGHVKCGAMAGILDLNELKGLKEVHKHLLNCSNQFTKHDLERLRASEERESSLEELIELNVKQQMNNLLSYEFINQKVNSGELKIYGWVYDFINGKIVKKLS